MRLIDADKLYQETEENMYNNPYLDSIRRDMHKREHNHFLSEIRKQPTINCKECKYGKEMKKEE